IKRPRNSFIIFRCDYVRDHSGTALTGSDKYKRLSKRAADAWRKLPRAKKAEYVQLSAKEKEEHARLYPDYIYRPNKR
ncbi:high mobility group box domain-containing protein, partial [Amylostereum chailletii]